MRPTPIDFSLAGEIKIIGGKPLKGSVVINGAKNSVLKLMAASILTDETCTIKNVPDISDITYMSDVLASIGHTVRKLSGDEISISRSSDSTINTDIPFDLVNPFRAAINVLGPLLVRYGRAKLAIPGGDPIGARKLDIHINGLAQLGAEIDLGTGYVEARADKLHGANIRLDFPSVGATENIMMAAVMADGETNIINSAREPEIIDLANFLKLMGAKITGEGTSLINISGVSDLGGASHCVIGDRIEAATYLIAAAITRGEIDVRGVDPLHLRMVLNKLQEIGVTIDDNPEELLIKAKVVNGYEHRNGSSGINGNVVNYGGKNGDLSGTNIATLPFPGFPTDVQAQMMALLSIAAGDSVITENVFENRFLYTHELKRMNADISITGHYAMIKGGRELKGCKVKATDIRGGAALACAALAATGTTLITDTFHIERGYCHFVDKLTALGADISAS